MKKDNRKVGFLDITGRNLEKLKEAGEINKVRTGTQLSEKIRGVAYE